MKKWFAILLCFFSLTANATHLRCGNLSLKHVSGLTYEIKIIVYTNTGSPVRFSDGTLNFGDGITLQTPTIENTIISSGLGTVAYAVRHTFPATGTYTITYSERNLAANILNIANSVNTPFYLETSVFLDAAVPYFSPDFLAPPIFWQAAGKPFSLSQIATDKNDYQLRYQLTSPLSPDLTSFKMPETLSVNYYNGQVTWDTKYKDGFYSGEYLFALKIIQLDKNGKKIGDLIRSFQVVLEDIDGEITLGNPIKDENNKVFVPQGKNKSIKVWAEAGAKQVNWEAFSDNIIAANFSFSQYDSTSGSKNYRVASIGLTATPSILRDNPYMITLRAQTAVNEIKLFRDLSLLFFTKDITLPTPPSPPPPPTPVVTATEFNSNEINVYPNPFANFISLKSNPNNLSEVEIVNASGQSVFRKEVSGDILIETPFLPSGFYILRVKNEYSVNYFKIVKE
jgi:Secretion system C-terminal sorting domain